MANDAKRDAIGNVMRKIGRIADGGGTLQDMTKPTDYGAFVPAPADPRGREMGRTKTEGDRPAFGRWLLLQTDNDGFLGQLANAVRLDRSFPKDGDPEAVRKHLSAQGADPPMHEALDDAELEWSTF